MHTYVVHIACITNDDDGSSLDSSIGDPPRKKVLISTSLQSPVSSPCSGVEVADESSYRR